MLIGNTSAGRSSGLSSLKLFAIGNAAADFFDYFPKGSSHGNLYQAGVVNLTTQCKYLGSLGFLCTHGGKPLGTIENDLGNIGVGFHII